MYTWHKIENITVAALQENIMKEFLVADKRIGLLKREGNIYAFTALCPHAGGNLCEGWLDKRGRIVCPVHNYHFDPATGRNTTGEGYKLFTYPIEIKENEIFVGLLSS
jgi:nitrite reductase/ring-hydroxylating ferredoxin subunit